MILGKQAVLNIKVLRNTVPVPFCFRFAASVNPREGVDPTMQRWTAINASFFNTGGFSSVYSLACA